MAEVSVTPEQLQQRDDEAAERKSLASTATSTVEASGVRDPSHSETSSITEFSHSVTVFVSDMSGFTSTHFNPHDQMSCHFQVVNGFKMLVQLSSFFTTCRVLRVVFFVSSLASPHFTTSLHTCM